MKKNKTKRDKKWARLHLDWMLYMSRQDKGRYWANQVIYAKSILNH